MTVNRSKGTSKAAKRKPMRKKASQRSNKARKASVRPALKKGPEWKGASLSRHEPLASYNSRIRAIGNSNGVILSSDMLEIAGIERGADIIIYATDGVIYIKEAKSHINIDLTSWDKHFKAAIKKGAKPEKDLFDGLTNKFDETEW